MTMHMPHNPLGAVAREAMDMGDKHSSKAFQTVAIVSMGVMAFAGASQVLLELFKAINRPDHRRHDEHRQDERSAGWREREDERRGHQGRERG